MKLPDTIPEWLGKTIIYVTILVAYVLTRPIAWFCVVKDWFRTKK